MKEFYLNFIRANSYYVRKVVVFHLLVFLSFQSYAQYRCFGYDDDRNTMKEVDKLTGRDSLLYTFSGISSIECIAFATDTNIIYVGNDSEFGYYDISENSYYKLSGNLSGKGYIGTSLKTESLYPEGMYYDNTEKVMYAISRTGSLEPELLFKINPMDGSVIRNAFGTNKDFIEITKFSFNRVDDIAIHPTSGKMYGVLERLNQLIAIDKNTGNCTVIGTISISDVESLCFDNSGQLFALTGKSSSNKNAWIKINTSSASATLVGYTSMVDADGCDCQPEINSLPVEFVFINGKRLSDNVVMLNWATAGEIENNYFEIQRSENGQNFVDIGSVSGNGNSSRIIEYSFLDNTAFQSNLYYRIKQIDYNGNYEYTDVIAVSNTNNKGIVLSPNPANNLLNVTWDKTVKPIKIEIISVLGQVVWTSEGESIMEQTSVDVTNFDQGIYMVCVTENKREHFKRFVKFE
ncbi:MAG: T9SS type A sorting domain-containing protein [Flavobacteriales bacterium]|nr:T9SS type A sorting domain-containing protein [Flavobacteriales bacterium]